MHPITPTTTNPSILVGIVTYDGHRYAIEKLLDAIKKFTYRNFTLLFVDNSASDEYKKLLEDKGHQVIKDSAEGTRIERIIRGRNILRQACLDGGHDYLFFLDTDVIPPRDALERLLQHHKEVVSGVYLRAARRGDGKLEMLPSLFVSLPDGRIRTTRIQEVLKNDFIPIAAAGLGCCLIYHTVLKKITFRNISTSTTGGEDAAFFKDVISLGITPYTDTRIKCFHMTYPEGDKRNVFYTFENYKIKKE